MINFKFPRIILRNYVNINRILLFLLALGILFSLFPREGKFKYEFQLGRPWSHDDLFAPFDFAILKAKSELEQERKAVLKENMLFFKEDTLLLSKTKQNFLNKLEDEWSKQNLSKSKSTRGKPYLIQVGFAIIDSVYGRGVLQPSPQVQNKPDDLRIAVSRDNVVAYAYLGQFFTIKEAGRFISENLVKKKVTNSELLLPLLQSVIDPNILYDENLTQRQQQQALSDISLTRGMVQKGERIISTGEIVRDAKYQVLESLKREYEEKSGYSYNYRMISLGRLILISMTLLVFGLFLQKFRHDIYLQNKNVILLLSLTIIMVAVTRLVLHINPLYLMAVPVCLVPIIVRTFYDTRLALFVHNITIILLAFLVPNSFGFLFTQLITGIVTIISIVHLHKRAQFFFTSLMIFLSYSVLHIGMTLMQEGTLATITGFNFGLFAVSALLTLFSYPLVYIFEKIFGLVTDVSLIELSDSNSKILRELAIEAPGTYQHSMIVANMAEDAARAIGANGLLARTGAYYHDIGKIDTPVFFIENQKYGLNLHDNLTSEESAKIIINHVAKGIERAKANKIPPAIIDFIRTHHGTNLTLYFYRKQLESMEAKDIDETKFRYPGPSPFSKETSIVMMADSVEAATRSLKAPTQEDIENMVENVVEGLIANKQFRNAPITLREITNIKKVFVKKLMSMHHVRVSYDK